MEKLISLAHFRAEKRKYHIYELDTEVSTRTPHYHDYYQLCYVAQGALCHRQDAENVWLEQGDCFLIPPKFRHMISAIRPQSKVYSLSFHPTLFHTGFPQSNVYKFLVAIGQESDEKKLSVRLRLSLNSTQRRTMLSLMECLIREQQANVAPDTTAAASLIAAALCILSQAYLSDLDNRLQLNTAEYYNRSMEYCLEYIEQNLCLSLSADHLAHQFAMSRSTFFVLFKRATGKTLNRYVNDCRIALAKSLIEQNPHKTMLEIAHSVGYEDASTFYRNFVRLTGTTPTGYSAMVSQSTN